MAESGGFVGVCCCALTETRVVCLASRATAAAAAAAVAEFDKTKISEPRSERIRSNLALNHAV